MFVEFEPGEKYAKDYTITADTPNSFQDAGYVLTEQDIVVDIDGLDKEVIKKMIEQFHIETETVWTDRGAHLYFHKETTFRGSQRICALGFKIEYKHIKNTKAITIKRNGVLREVINKGVRQDMPEFFKSMKKYDSLQGIGEGERNNAMFTHRIKLGAMQGWQGILRFINNFVIDVPLEEKEFQTVIRDVQIAPEKGNEPAIARDMIQKYKIVDYSGHLYFREKGDYISHEGKLERLIDQEVQDMTSRFTGEIKEQIRRRAKLLDPDKIFDIKLKNGILRAGQFIEVEYEDFTPFNIPINYFDDAEPVKIVDDYIKHLTNGEPEYRNLLLEIIGSTLITDPEFKRVLAKFFIFVGDGGNGKGTLLAIMNALLGSQNLTTLSPKNMVKEQYLVTMIGKLANLGDDIDNCPINDDQMKMLKNISTCDAITVRELFKQSFTGTITSSLIFTSNHVLKSFEKGESYKRRVMWLPMYGKPSKKDPKFITKITSEKALEYWMKLAVEGYLRLYEEDHFTESPVVETFNAGYHEDNNPTKMFLADTEAEDFIGKKPQSVYEEFEIWQTEEGEEGGSKKMLKETICSTFGLEVRAKKIQGKTHRVYAEKE